MERRLGTLGTIAVILFLLSPAAARAAPPVCSAPAPMTAASGATLHVWGFYACDDSDGDVLTYDVVTAPEHGSVAITGADLAYRSDAGYMGADSFAFKANDGTMDSNTVTVSITVGPNQPPSCRDEYFFDAEPARDTTFDPGWDLLPCYDPEGEPLTFEAISPPAHGTLSAYEPGVGFTYHPDAGYRARTRSHSRPATAWGSRIPRRCTSRCSSRTTPHTA